MDYEPDIWFDWDCYMCSGHNEVSYDRRYDEPDYVCVWCGYPFQPEDYPFVGENEYPEKQEPPDNWSSDIPF